MQEKRSCTHLFVVMEVKLLCVHRLVEGPGIGGVLLAEHLLDDLVARLHRLRHPVLGLAAVLGQRVWHLLQWPLDLAADIIRYIGKNHIEEKIPVWRVSSLQRSPLLDRRSSCLPFASPPASS